MPIIKGKSPKAFEHNMKAEMEAGKPKAQALAIAYSVKRKAMPKRKMAEGGSISASNEKRPMPDQRADDAQMVAHNSGNKAPKNDSWTSKVTEDQAQMNNSRKVAKIKHPRMVPSDAFSVRLRDEEDDLQSSAKVNDGPQRQPPEHDNEEDAMKMGKNPDMSSPHNDKQRKAYAKGGEINNEMSMKDAEEDQVVHPTGLESDDDMMGDKDAMDDHMVALAEGGEIHHEMDDQPVDEEETEHASSIAAAIMAKMRHERFAEGGEVNGHDSIYTHEDEDQADLSRNAEEDANMEDQASFDALRKENYSESEGLSQLDSPMDSAQHGDSREDEEENIHDKSIVGRIRSKMKSKSPMTR